MAVSFKIPKSPQKSIMTIDEFKGVDFTNSPASVDENKSPNAINMIRDVPGKVRKRMGYEVIKDFTQEVQIPDNYIGYDVDTFEIYDTTISVINNGDGTLTIDGGPAPYPDRPSYFSTGEKYHLSEGDYVFVLDIYNPMTYELPPSTIAYTIEARVRHNTGHMDAVLVALSDDDSTRFTANFTMSSEADDVEVFINLGYPFDNLGYTNYKISFMVVDAESYYEGMPFVEYGEKQRMNVNGYHYRRGDTEGITHINRYMFIGNTLAYSFANDAISHSWQFDDKLFIMDGKRFLIYNGTTIEPVENIAYIPLTYTDREPIHGEAGGGGKKVDDINLLQPQFVNEFIVTSDWSTAKQFPLSVQNLDVVPITVEVLDSNGEWQPKTVTTDYTVDYPNGIVTFVTAPGVTPIRGVPNVKITASRTVEGYADRINKCTFGTRFGVNGAFDRLFVSGNPDYPNSDWYSEEWDCSYFPDTSYSQLGSSKSAVVGYSIVSNYLAAHKDELEEDLSIIVREGDLITNDSGVDKPSFRIINTLQGAGAIASNSFAYLCTEPLFLTRSGLYAVTAQDITGEKYAQSRSFYLNGKLTKEDFANLQKSFSIIYDDMYILCVNHDAVDEQGEPYIVSSLYILDGLQPMRTDKSEPYSTRQYAGFYCEMKDINCMWERENRLYFGTANGKVCRFYNDKKSQGSYNDEGHAISCQWETPDIDGQLFYKNKSLRYIALRAGAAIATSVEIWGMDRGIWKFIKRDDTFGRYLSFEDIDFSKFTFSCDQTEQLARAKVRIKKVDKYRLRFINNELNEPFVIYNIANEYVENGNYKG